MEAIDGTVLDFKRLERLAMADTLVHRLDPRAKVLVTCAFIMAVVSFGRYELTPLFPFFIFPAVMIALGDLPPRYIAAKICLVLPFALAVGILNPLFDREVVLRLGPLGVSGGWISCASIAVRAMLTVGAALTLVGTTGFPAICQALARLGMPQAFAVQLLFLYRYIFVLAEEGSRAARARELRSFGNKGVGVRSYGSLLGHLLVRTWQRAERIHMAMLARGFSGGFQLRRPSRFGAAEFLYLLGWSVFFIVLRLWNASQFLGALVMGIFR